MKTTRLKTPQEERNRENEKTFARKQNRRTAKELQTYRCFQKPFPMPRYAMISLKVLEQIVPVEEMPVAKTAILITMVTIAAWPFLAAHAPQALSTSDCLPVVKKKEGREG